MNKEPWYSGTDRYRYPFFHWATGLAICAAGIAGLITGMLIGIWL